MTLMSPMTIMTRPFTSVPVKPETLKRLRQYKVAGKTYDDILNDFMDGTPTEEFWAEMQRQMETPRLKLDKKKGEFR